MNINGHLHDIPTLDWKLFDKIGLQCATKFLIFATAVAVEEKVKSNRYSDSVGNEKVV